MALIELRECTVSILDGLAGTASVTSGAPVGGNTTLSIGSVALNTNVTNKVPLGARFTIPADSTAGTYTVTARTPSSSAPTTSINFTPGLGAAVAGTAHVAQAAPIGGETTLTIGTTSLNTSVTDQVPVGARFVVAGDSTAAHYTVTQSTPATGTTTSIKFTPALGAPSTSYTGTDLMTFSGYATAPVLTFKSQKLDIKVGNGDLKYTESVQYKYDLDRGNLDQVRQGDEVPMDVTMQFIYEHITQGTSEPVSPMDALQRVGGAAEWVSSASDKCEPYSVDIQVFQKSICNGTQDETTLFPDFRSDKREISYKDASITITGKCNATVPVVTRT